MAESKRGQERFTISRSVLSVALLVSGYFFNVGAQDGPISEEQIMGISYGQLADNLPPPSESAILLSAMPVGKVKIYDANHDILDALASTGIYVAISVTSDLIPGMAANCEVADQWIVDNVLAFPNTAVRYIIAGNELFSDSSQSGLWYQVLPAMQCLHAALLWRNANNVKVTTSLAMDILAVSYPPSAGAFRDDIAIPLMQPILQFISSTQSYFFINAYPYFAWAYNSDVISINYALFTTGADEVIVIVGPYTYTNLLDAQIDALIAAMEQISCGGTNIAIGETGWPTYGDPGELGANLQYAANYNRRLVRKTMANPPAGTPRRPGYFFPTYIFGLYNEDLKPDPTTERNWGLLYPDTGPVYPIDMTGQLPDSSYPPLPGP